MRFRTRIEAGLLGVTALALVATVHCGDDSTGRSPATFPVTARSTRVTGMTSAGWQVTITEGHIRLGAVRWFEGLPLTHHRVPSLLRNLSFGTAYAHPGHYVPGQALAETTREYVIDLLAMAPVSLGMAEGVTGEPHSARIEVRPPIAGEANADLLRGGTYSIQGTATRDGQTVRFSAAPQITLEVQGITAEGVIDTTGAAWSVEVDPISLVDRLDFSTLPAPSMEGGVVEVPATGQGANALLRGAQSSTTYHLRRTMQ